MPMSYLRAPVRAITVLSVLLATLTLTGQADATGAPSCATAGIGVTSLGGPNFYIDSGSSPAFRSGYTGYKVTNSTGSDLDDVWVSLSGFTGGSLALASGQAASQRAGDLATTATAARFWYLTAAATSASAQNHTITVYRHNPALPNAVALCTTTNGFASVQGTLGASANKVTGISVTGGTPKLGSVFTVTVTGDTGTIGQGITGDAQSLWMTPAVAENWPADAFRLVGTSLTISPDGSAPAQTYTDTLRVAGLGSTGRPYTAAYTFQAIGFTGSPTTVKPVQEIASGTQVKHTGSYSVALPAIQPAVSDLSVAVASSASKLEFGGGNATLTGSVSGTAGAELDAFTLTLPAGASVVPGTSTWGGAPIDDPVGTGTTKVFTGPFVVGTDTLSVQIAYDGTSGNRTATLVANVGNAQVGSSPSPTDGSNPASVTVNVDTSPTADNASVATRPDTPITINLGSLVSDADGDPWTVFGLGGSVGAVSLNGRLVVYTPPEGFQGLDSFFYVVNDGRGATANGMVSIDVNAENAAPAPLTQTITFNQPDDMVYGDTTTLVASSDSGLPVTFNVNTPATCSVVGDQVTAVGTGQCSVTADQEGDATFAAADSVTQAFSITAAPVVLVPQSIDFATPDPMLVGDSADLTASASSGLTVSFTSTTPEVCLVTAGGHVTAVAAGDCTIIANQPGDQTFDAAEPVSWTFAVDQVTQSIDFTTPDPLHIGDEVDLTATADSGLPVTFAVLTPATCGVVGSTVTAVAAGDCTIEASQDGNGTYAAADPVSRTFAIDKLAQTIDFTALDPLHVTDDADLTATADSGLPVTFTVLTPATCAVVDNTVSAVAAGDCTIEATQDGNGTYAAAEPVSRTFAIDQVVQSIDFNPATSVLGIGTPYDLDASATSELPVSFTVADGGVCSIEGNSLQAESAGSCTVTAMQEGDGTYAPAEPVQATITFTLPADDAATTPGATPVGVDVLANDPDGVVLDSVGEPAYGTTEIIDGVVVYTPDPEFRGTDTFSYTVSDGERSADAIVEITVDNQDPVVDGGSISQLAGTTRWVVVNTDDPNDDPVTLSATSPNPLVGVVVVGKTLAVTAGNAASGNVTITLTATDDAGGTATTTVTTRITPLAPTGVGRRLADNGTTVRWTPAPTAGAGYEVLLDGQVVCRTSAASCTFGQIAGPKRAVTMRTVGRDGTRSGLVRAPLVGHGQVLVATIYFASASDRLTPHDRRVLDTAIRKVHRYGFGRAQLNGYTDTDGGVAYNEALSFRRTKAVAGYLLRRGDITSAQSWHGETDPVASNDVASGKAKNRRVEVLVRY